MGVGSRRGGDWVYECQDSENNFSSYVVNQREKKKKKKAENKASSSVLHSKNTFYEQEPITPWKAKQVCHLLIITQSHKYNM